MNAVLDVGYRGGTATVACVCFDAWSDGLPAAVRVSRRSVPADYEPGRFYLRELPCLLHALALETARFDTLVIDGYVHLKGPRRKGLGVHLAESLPYRVSVIGLAKNPLRMADRCLPVFRGESRRPLFVSALHLPPERAAARIREMAGPFRIPTLVRLADRLSRGLGDAV